MVLKNSKQGPRLLLRPRGLLRGRVDQDLLLPAGGAGGRTRNLGNLNVLIFFKKKRKI